MPRCGTTFDENVGGAFRAAIGRFNQGPEIAAADSGSHFLVQFSGELEEKTRIDNVSNKTSQEFMVSLDLMVSSVAGKPEGAARPRLAFPF